MNVLLPVMYLILLLLLKSHNITDRTFSIFPFKDAPFKVHLCFFQENLVNWKSKFQFVRVNSTVCEKSRWEYRKPELSLTNSMDKIQKQCYDSVKQGVDGKKGANHPEVKISLLFCKGIFHPWVGDMSTGMMVWF